MIPHSVLSFEDAVRMDREERSTGQRKFDEAPSRAVDTMSHLGRQSIEGWRRMLIDDCDNTDEQVDEQIQEVLSGLQYEEADATGRLIVEHLASSCLRLAAADQRASRVPPTQTKLAAFWQRQLREAEKAFLSAGKALAEYRWLVAKAEREKLRSERLVRRAKRQ